VHSRQRIDRREFLRRSALAGAGAGLLPALGVGAAQPPGEVRRRVRLGRTELRVSDIGFGAGRLRDDPGLVAHALERGINYFDTAGGYGGGESERMLGEALAGRREDVVLVSKVKAGARDTRNEIMAELETSLKRLRTDRVEIYLNHAVNHVGRMRNEEWGEFVVRAKEQGKIRFAGMSGHGGRLVECLEWSLDHELLDVILVGYNFGHDRSLIDRFTSNFDFVALQPGLPEFLAKAKAKDVGVVAMKTLLGARINDMRAYEVGGATFAQAAFRWVLANPHVDNLIVSMKSRALIDEYLGASGSSEAARGDGLLLERYLAQQGEQQCRYGCGDCVTACPHGVPISDVLRTRMYDVDYGEPQLAAAEYAALGAPALACTTCSGAPCATACSHGLDIRRLALEGHQRLG
jgi:predicted aldo/keto reductase-like oxidoreductase